MIKDSCAINLSHETQESWDDLFLDWFSGRGVPMIERRHSLGRLSYFHFGTQFKTVDGRLCTTHGRSQNRKLAAIKAAAECVERQFMTDFFVNQNCRGEAIPQSLRTSNGWAVHSTKEAAKAAAISEAMERHLLLKSYFANGWQGFRLAQTIKSPEMDLYFLVANTQFDGNTSGLVVAKSPKFQGVSFGYCFGNVNDISLMRFWESAIHEAADKILVLDGKSIDLSLDPQSWLLKEVKHYLESPFDLSVLDTKTTAVADKTKYTPTVLCFDLSEEWDLNFPLYAAFVFGGGLIPLFSKSTLVDEEARSVEKILILNGIREIPERHPIL